MDPVWIADYEPANTGPTLFGDFKYSTFWQYSSTAKVSGIADAVDVELVPRLADPAQPAGLRADHSERQATSQAHEMLVQPAEPGLDNELRRNDRIADGPEPGDGGRHPLRSLKSTDGRHVRRR